MIFTKVISESELQMNLKKLSRNLFVSRDNIQTEILNKSILKNEVQPIQVDDFSANILSLLVRLHQPESVLEIGTHFGYSTYSIAKNLPSNSDFISLDISKSIQSLAADNLEESGLSDRVQLVHSDALSYLKNFPDKKFDFVFIDGAKIEYLNYLVHIVNRINKGGVLIADDIFLHGDFSDEPGTEKEMTDSVTKYLIFLNKVDSIETTLIPTEMGMTVSVFL